MADIVELNPGDRADNDPQEGGDQDDRVIAGLKKAVAKLSRYLDQMEPR